MVGRIARDGEKVERDLTADIKEGYHFNEFIKNVILRKAGVFVGHAKGWEIFLPFVGVLTSLGLLRMCEIETALNNFEESYRRLSGTCKFQKTGSPNVFCSKLPSHWRSNKSLPTPFVVLILDPVPDGTKITVAAGNEENCSADVKNNITEINGQMARFSDLRFVGKSGRGKNFNLSIILHTSPLTQVAIVPGVIKVTVDGPRDSRNANKFLTDYRKRPLPFDTLPSTSAMDFSHLALKRGRFNRHGLGDFGHPLSLATPAVPPTPLGMFMAAAAQTPLNPLMLNMLSTVPPPILPMMPNSILAANQLAFPPFLPLTCTPPIPCPPSIVRSPNKPANNRPDSCSKQESDSENVIRPSKSPKDTKDVKVWRPY